MTDDLQRALAAAGARFGTFQGLTLPLDFGDPAREWRAARESAGIFVAFRTLIAASGDDRVSFLHGMLSNEVRDLTPGSGVYAASLTLQGKVVADLRVYADVDRLALDVVTWRAALLQEKLDGYLIADDVELSVPADEQPLLGLEGPLAAAVVGEALGMAPPSGPPWSHVPATFEGRPLRVVVASECERRGILLCGPAAAGPALFAACREAGGQGLGMRALDTLRIEAGIGWAGLDMDESVLLQETGRDAAISFTKGCYLGQETIERVAARGHVNRHLAGLRCAGERLPAPRAPLLVEGREVGYVTSVARAATDGPPIALAMINRKYMAPGQALAIGGETEAIAARVTGLPFEPVETD